MRVFDVLRLWWQGADDHLVKVWTAETGRLVCTFRGHAAEITDIACNASNTLLAVGSCDKLIRIWCLQTAVPVAVLHGHTHMITSVRVRDHLLCAGGEGYWHQRAGWLH